MPTFLIILLMLYLVELVMLVSMFTRDNILFGYQMDLPFS